MAPKIRQLATIQVDLDGLWTNLQYYGHSSPLTPDSLFQSSLRRYLDLFEEFGIKATFFVIGKDVAVPEKRALLVEAHHRGHELANHTSSHIFGFKNLSSSDQLKEIVEGENAIESITGKKPAGFKAPGYDADTGVLARLSQRGYLYDSSIIPTFAYPLLMRINSFISGGVRRTHGPKWSWALAPNKPYFPSSKNEWKREKNSQKSLLEIPCTTMPFLRIPIHTTFVVKLGLPYFRGSYHLVKSMNIPLNYEFHAADLADPVNDSRLGHLNGLPLEKRIRLVRKILLTIVNRYDVVTTEELARRTLSHAH